jgi:predicted phage terminase large subunit-like protein
VLIEDKASGISLIQELESGTRIPVKKIKIDSDKVSRCHSITPLIEAGKVFIDNLADWKNDFIDECESFPEGQFDDRVDSVTQFLNYARVIQFRYELKDLVRTKRYIPDRYKNFRI